SSTHTLYVGNADDGPISMIDTATCNALQTSGCNQAPSVMVNGDGMTIDPSNHSVYVNDANDQIVTVLNGLTCNVSTQSDCSATSVAPFPSNAFPLLPGVDTVTHTLYVPFGLGDVLGGTAVIDATSCNGSDRSG